jgi:DNA polymerase I-like protein with 3'-5' exonuclease and polymerase domains
VTSCCNATGYTSIEEGLDLLSKADTLIGHNIINFDIRALGKVHPDFRIKDDCVLYDTLIISRVLAPELEQVDDKKYTHIESKYRGKHSLAAWGERLGVQKIKFVEESKAKLPESADPWDSWSEAMQAYCEGDTLVSLALYEYFLTQDLDPRCQELEHEFACIMTMMETFGFPFNEQAAYALVNTLKARRSELHDQLQEVFPPLIEKRVSAKTGKPLKDKITIFNPASRKQTAERLQERYPEIVFNETEKGNKKLDDDILEVLGKDYPEAGLLAEFQLLNKRLGQIAEGKEAWLKHCQVYEDSRIHGTVITNACISGRCS